MSNINQDAIKNTMQYELLNKYRTDNPIFDAIISFIVFSLVAIVMNKLNDLASALISLLKWIYNLLLSFVCELYDKIRNCMGYQKEECMTKEVIIDYITDNRKINELYKAVYWYLSNTFLINYTRESPVKYSYETNLETIKNINDFEYLLNQTIMYDNENKFCYDGYEIYYIYNRNIINIYSDQEKKRENYTIKLWTKYRINSTSDVLNKFCQFCVSEYVKNINKKKWEQHIYVNKNGVWECQRSNNKRSIDTIILKNNLKDVIKNDIKTFLESEEWYNDRDIPYTRGYLFYGVPGCGKTSMIKGISKYCERHIHYLMLNNISSDNELIELLKKIDYKTTILVIEDIDCMTNIIQKRDESNNLENIKRELNELKNIVNEKQSSTKYEYETKQNNITLSGLLNAIDGIFDNYGRILIITTNHPEVLDKALIRPGRIDKKILFDNCDKKQIADIYKMFFNKEIDQNKLGTIEEYKYSPAFVTKLFLQYRDNPENALDSFNEAKL